MRLQFVLNLKFAAIGCAVVFSAGLIFAGQSGPSLTSWQNGGPYTLSQVLSGTVVPLELKKADLPSNYKPVRISEGSPSWLDLMMLSSGSGNPMGDSRLMAAMVSYSSGEVITIDGVRYYVTYKQPAGNPLTSETMDAMPPAATAGTGGTAATAGWTPNETPPPSRYGFHLELIKVESVYMIVPMPEEKVLKADSRTEALSRAKQLGLATLMYTNDYDDTLPYAQSTDEVKAKIMPYTKNMTVFQSTEPGGRFLYNTHLSGVSSSAIPSPAETPAWKEELPDRNMPFAVSYIDGHARLLKNEQRPTLETAWNARFPVSHPTPAQPAKRHK